MQIIKSIHVTATERKLINLLVTRFKQGDISEGDGVFSKRKKVILTKLWGDMADVLIVTKEKDYLGQPHNDYQKIVILI